MLAKILANPGGMLIMDEPTNDLDMETLELLEERLVNYDGTVLLVSHDRVFLDNVVTSVLVFSGQGIINEYVGGYSDWLKYQTSLEKAAKKDFDNKTQALDTAKQNKQKLSYKEQKELQQLPELIEQQESRQAELNTLMASPDFYQQDKKDIDDILEELKKLNVELEQTYLRWEELDEMS
jgi:ATP-binding cassette subfamily F protein uup